MASWSRRLESDVEELRGRFAVLETLRDDSKSQCLHSRNRFISIAAVAQHAWQRGHLDDPAPVFLAFQLDRESHMRNVPSGQPSTKLSSKPSSPLDCQGNEGGNRGPRGVFPLFDGCASRSPLRIARCGARRTGGPRPRFVLFSRDTSWFADSRDDASANHAIDPGWRYGLRSQRQIRTMIRQCPEVRRAIHFRQQRELLR
jgi:hypothetical protein